MLVRFKESLDLAGRVGCVVWESCGMLEYGRDRRGGMWRSEVYPFGINATAVHRRLWYGCCDVNCVVTLHKLSLFHINRAAFVILSTTTFLESFLRQPQ